MQASAVSVIVRDGRTRYLGLETCGSVWHCPVCAAPIAERRRQDVEAVFDAHAATGGTVWLATLTVRHGAMDGVGDLRAFVARAWSKVLAGRVWKRIAGAAGVVGWVRGLEVTHGGNGWHPHLHVAVLLAAGVGEDAAQLFGVQLFERWAGIVDKSPFGPVSPEAFRFERAVRAKAVGDYVAKWGADEELAKSNLKRGRGGNRTPWQLLADAANGDRWAARLWQAYAETFKGARWITWSVGVRERYGLVEATDEQAAADDGIGEVLGTFGHSLWRRIVFRGFEVAVLEAAEAGGWAAVVALLKREGVFHAGAPPPEKSATRPAGCDPGSLPAGAARGAGHAAAPDCRFS